jgi:hypothetical protein
MESSDAFVKLREEILQHAMPLLDSDAVPVDDRFRLSFQIAQTNGTLEAYKKALAVAEKLDEDGKLLAYLDLLSDVDYVIQEKRDGGASAQPKPTAAIEAAARAEETRGNTQQSQNTTQNQQQ